jgi:hypothetical protein
MTSPSPNWRFELIAALASPQVPRVLSYGQLLALARTIRESVTDVTMGRVVKDMALAGVLTKVSNGVYLNKKAFPAVSNVEAAPFIRSGAVLSLQSVLGEFGIINNPSDITTAVVPFSPTRRAGVGSVETESGLSFRFYGLPERFFPPEAGTESELYVASKPFACFRPEKCLLDWLYLGASSKSSVTPPPYDIDIEGLDLELLTELAERLRMKPILDTYLAQAKALNYGAEPEADTERSQPLPVYDLEQLELTSEEDKTTRFASGRFPEMSGELEVGENQAPGEPAPVPGTKRPRIR